MVKDFTSSYDAMHLQSSSATALRVSVYFLINSIIPARAALDWTKQKALKQNHKIYMKKNFQIKRNSLKSLMK